MDVFTKACDAMNANDTRFDGVGGDGSSLRTWWSSVLMFALLSGSTACGPDPAEFKVNLTSEPVESSSDTYRFRATARLDGTEISEVDDSHIDRVIYEWSSLSIEQSKLDSKKGQRNIVLEDVDSRGIMRVRVRVNRSGITGPAQRDLEGGATTEFGMEDSTK
jgi:hypothetical protein